MEQLYSNKLFVHLTIKIFLKFATTQFEEFEIKDRQSSIL